MLPPLLAPTAPPAPAQDGWLDLPAGVVLATGMLVALLCLVASLNGRPPGRLTVGATWLVQAAALGLGLVYLLRQLSGDQPAGPGWELWAYLVTIFVLPALALVWAREEPSRWSTAVLAVAAFTVGVMAARCAQIWAGLGTLG